MTPAVLTTVGLVGLYMAISINLIIVFAERSYGKLEIAATMGLVPFSMMLIVAAYECRDEKATIFRRETFDNKSLNITIIAASLALIIGYFILYPYQVQRTHGNHRTAPTA